MGLWRRNNSFLGDFLFTLSGELAGDLLSVESPPGTLFTEGDRRGLKALGKEEEQEERRREEEKKKS